MVTSPSVLMPLRPPCAEVGFAMHLRCLSATPGQKWIPGEVASEAASSDLPVRHQPEWEGRPLEPLHIASPAVSAAPAAVPAALDAPQSFALEVVQPIAQCRRTVEAGSSYLESLSHSEVKLAKTTGVSELLLDTPGRTL
jgi:hypothetical protein